MEKKMAKKMAKKEPSIKTKRLMIQPMSNEEIRDLIQKSDSEELRQAYSEMLSGCEENPEQRIWYAPWKMILKRENVYIGDLGFKGPQKNNAVEIGYGILKEYEGQGFTTEAVKALTEWAFANEDIYFVEAETAPDNIASQRVLQKNGFTADGEGAEGPRFVRERGETAWMSIYTCFGISIGCAVGTSMDNMAMGMTLGIGIGMCLEAALDASQKKKRKEIREKRQADKKQG